ncbi:hypothetical protein [Paraflavitalea speifideaquila]|uniref:hypothetical protein n=1 Tax=Paraflavitalea speifideaquila TaxID=3076558 RepID=UPI0028E70CF0|nr:hypothetical protein [Paraflavitalea speifideiaquila]
MSSLTIRIATAEDASVIADLSRKTFYDSFAADNTPEDIEKFMNEQFTREKLIAEVSDPASIFYWHSWRVRSLGMPAFVKYPIRLNWVMNLPLKLPAYMRLPITSAKG